MRVLAGTSGFSYKEWKGSFYPAKLKNDEMLGHYAQKLPAVEINNTFYRMPKTSVVEGWAAATPPGFRFAVKASRRITHFKRLKEPEEPVAYLLKQTAVLGERLGPLLFQLPPELEADPERLAALLELIPAGQQVVLEPRHPSWFDEPVYELLRRRDVALCLADHAKSQRNAPRVATASWGYFRFRRDDYDDGALREVAGWIGQRGWSVAYVFFKHGTGGAPAQAARFIELCGG